MSRAALVGLRDLVAEHLVRLEDDLKRAGWPGKPAVTCIVRDPSNDQMFSVTTNDPSLEDACRVALSPPAQVIEPGERP